MISFKKEYEAFLDELKEFESSNMFINIDYKSIDMQDVADPIKSLEHFYTFKPLATIDRRLRVEYELASNDFIDQRDLLGIMDQEPEPYKFL